MKGASIRELTELVMAQAREKGFGTRPDEVNVAEKIALIHSEITEAFTAFRHNNMDGKDGFHEELGDAVQRILHLCGIFGVNVEAEILKKISANKERTWDWTKMNEKHS